MTRFLKVALLCTLAIAAGAPVYAQEGGFLGINYREVRPAEAAERGWPTPRGTFVASVVTGSPAEKVGLKVGDVILSIDGVETNGQYQKTRVDKDGKGSETHVTFFFFRLADVLSTKRPGQEVTLRIAREKAEFDLKATLIARPPPSASASASPPKMKAAPPPACRGMDLLAQLKEKDPTAYAEIKKAAAEALNGRALLWRIDKAGFKPSYLFGTVHVSDERVHALSPAFMRAFESTTRLALEIDLSPEAVSAGLAKAGKYFAYAPGRSLKTELKEADYKATEDILRKRGVPVPNLDAMRPWQISIVLALPVCEAARQGQGLQSLDGRLAEMAKARGAPVIGLETVADQIGAMASLKPEHEAAILVGTIRTYDRSDDHFETMIRLYLNREIGALFTWQRQMIRQFNLPTAALDEFEEALVTRRNRNMRDAALPQLAKGELFIAVGAGHLAGRDGLVELIRGAGYTLTAIE